MNINRELLSKAIDMLKTFAADQVALDPGSRGEYSHKQCVEVIEGLEDNLYSYIGIQQEISDLVQKRIKTALLLCNGNKSAAADLLGLPSYQTLTNWMAKHGVEND